MSRTTFYTDDGKKILAGAGITLSQCDEMWRRIHGEGHRIIGMVAKADPIDLNTLSFGPPDLTDYSGVEVRHAG